MPIIQMPGNVDPRSIGSTLNAGINQFAGEKRQNDARMRELRERLKFQQAENEIRYAHAAQQEYARRAREDREYQLGLLLEQGRDRRFWQGKAVDAGLNPEISGENILRMGARLEELDPQGYQRFLEYARGLGLDFGEGEGQILPTADFLQGAKQAPALFVHLTRKLVPLEKVDDEREIAEGFAEGAQAVKRMDPEWFDSPEGLDWQAKYEADQYREDLTPTRATRIRKNYEAQAARAIRVKKARAEHADNLERLIKEHPLPDSFESEDALKRLDDLRRDIASAKTADEAQAAFDDAFAIVHPNARRGNARAFADGAQQERARIAAWRAQAERAAQLQAMQRQGDDPRPLPQGPRAEIDPVAEPGLAEALGASPTPEYAEFASLANQMGVDPADDEAAREVIREQLRRKHARGRQIP